MTHTQVDKATFHAAMQRYPTRQVSRTGICEPPQEQTRVDGKLVGRIVLYEEFGEPNRYYLVEGDTP